MSQQNILILHGPNLNLLGEREATIYGKHTLEDINQMLLKQIKNTSYSLITFQSNSEADLIEQIQSAKKLNTVFIIFNPAAYTHTSIALRDALLAVAIPFYEVHLSNFHAREPFRKTSYFSDIAEGIIAGFGIYSYQFALTACINKLDLKNKNSQN